MRWIRSRGSVPFVRRSLLHDPIRLTLSASGVTFAVVLVLLLRGIMEGTVASSTSYIDHVGADVFIAQAGVENMALASSRLPQTTVAEVERPGVQRATGIIRLNMIAAADDSSAPVQLVGYPVEAGLGGPWRLESGRRPETADEAVVDSVLAGELRVSIGDRISIVGREFVVVGLSGQTAAIAAKFVFIRLASAQDLLQMPGLVSFVLVDLAPGVNADEFALRLAGERTDLAVLTRSQLSDEDRRLLTSLFVGPINLMSTVGLLVGLAVVGLTMYTATNERIRDFGVLKALGAPDGYLYRAVLGQALIIGATGFVLGTLATLALSPLVTRLVPDIAVSLAPATAARALAFVLVISLVAAVVPLVGILRVDPLVVFRR